MENLKNYLKILKELGIEEIILEGNQEMEGKSLSLEEKQKIFQKLNQIIQECKKCDLYLHRKQAVLGEGNLEAKLMFVGEAPGADEDRLGRPFVGRAGKLLTSLIEKTGHKREEFYISNICKCRPPNNRTPLPDEMEACFPYLEEQIQIIDPKVICLLGATACYGFLKRPVKITKERGTVVNWNGKLLVLTYHPAYALRNLSAVDILFEDIKKAIELAYTE